MENSAQQTSVLSLHLISPSQFYSSGEFKRDAILEHSEAAIWLIENSPWIPVFDWVKMVL